MASAESDRVITAQDVRAALLRIRPFVHVTPVLTCAYMDKRASEGAPAPRRLFFKCELFQKTGSFKARGATNAVLSLSESRAPESGPLIVCTHSSGNHAQALAGAAAARGVEAHIVMPSNCPAVKRRAVEGYGAHVHECAPTQAAREAAAARVCEETGAEFVHPSEDPRVIAGQGTIAVELVEQMSGEYGPSPSGLLLDAVIVPIGGGGMISGMATYIKATDPRIRVIAAEPKDADDAFRSKAQGSIAKHASPPTTVADGLRTTLGPNTWPIVRDLVDEVVTVSEEEIIDAMRLVYERMKLVIEPSAAVGVAVALSETFRKRSESFERVGIVLCGGNVDLDALPFVRK